MGSYTPPSSAAVPSKLTEFSFEQDAAVNVDELIAAPKKLKTLQIRDIPLTTVPEPIEVVTVSVSLSAILKSAAFITLNVGLAAYAAGGARINELNPRITRASAIEGQSAVAEFGPQARADSPNPGLDLVIDAYMNGAATGVIRKLKFVAQILIPLGATVTEV